MVAWRVVAWGLLGRWAWCLSCRRGVGVIVGVIVGWRLHLVVGVRKVQVVNLGKVADADDGGADEAAVLCSVNRNNALGGWVSG